MTAGPCWLRRVRNGRRRSIRNRLAAMMRRALSPSPHCATPRKQKSMPGGTAMELRVFGRSGMRLSVLGFGCGAVGGLMVRGDPRDQERAIARALEAGVNYFDTAWQYGNGESEKNLGRILQTLKPADVIVGTKVRLPPADY